MRSEKVEHVRFPEQLVKGNSSGRSSKETLNIAVHTVAFQRIDPVPELLTEVVDSREVIFAAWKRRRFPFELLTQHCDLDLCFTKQREASQ